MISATTTQNVTRSGDFVESTFKIKASAKAFRILSDGLYSDKITAILRELSCNAYDAHQTAGTLDTQFHIKLPNQLEPNFYLRDFGTGLSDNAVRNIFTTYFESTKTDSNDQIGCLGLGSKSPFSYTDNFTVTSFYKGVKSIYNMFLNEQGVPSVALLCSENTTEPNGVEIGFGVKVIHINEFAAKAAKVFEYFKHKPKITGNSIIIPEIRYVEKRDGSWGLRGANNWGKARAVMGNIAYDMSDAKFETLTPSEASLLNLDIDIFFNIGDLDITASREKLSYDAQTKVVIKNKLSQIVQELAVEINNRVNNCKSLWEARCLLYEMTNGDLRLFRNIIPNIIINFNNETVKSSEIYFEENDNFIVTSHGFRSRRRRKTSYSSSGVTYLTPKKDIVFYSGDIDKGIKKRIAKLMLTNVDKYVYIITPKSGATLEDALKAFKVRVGMLDDVVIEPVSGLPFDAVVRAAQSPTNPNNYKKVFTFDFAKIDRNLDGSDYWEPATPDITKGGIYVCIDRYCIKSERANKYLAPYYEAYKKINPTVPLVLYGIKAETFTKRFANSPNWINLETYIATISAEYCTKNGLTEIFNIDALMNNIKLSGSYYTPEYISYFDTYAKSLLDVPKYKDMVAKILDISTKYNNLKDAAVLFKFIHVDEKVVEDYKDKIIKLFKDLVKDFPMIKCMSDVSSNREILCDYIKMVSIAKKMVDK